MDRDTSYVEDRPAVDYALLIMRVVAGVILAAHGSQKLFGWFGGDGMDGILKLAGQLGWLVAIGEFFGGLGLIFGILPRFSAAANIVTMIGAIAMVHWKNGFFLQNQGYEFNLALIGLLAPILIAGPGRFSLSHYVRLPTPAAARSRALE